MKDNQWVSQFFELISKNYARREYRCLTCGYVFGSSNGDELSEKATEHLKGNCKIEAE